MPQRFQSSVTLIGITNLDCEISPLEVTKMISLVLGGQHDVQLPFDLRHAVNILQINILLVSLCPYKKFTPPFTAFNDSGNFIDVKICSSVISWK